MKVKTYGIYQLTEWHGKLKAGTLEVKVSFTGGTASPSGAQPAYMVTKDPITQFVIENSKEFKDGFINLIFNEEIEGTHPRMAVPKPVVTAQGVPEAEVKETLLPQAVEAVPEAAESPAQSNAVVTGKDGDLTVVEVPDIDEARHYLNTTFEVAMSRMRYNSNVTQIAAEHGIVFKFPE